MPRLQNCLPTFGARLRRRGQLLHCVVCTCLIVIGASLQSTHAAGRILVPSSLEDLPSTTNIHHQTQFCTLCHQSGSNGILLPKARFGNNYRAGCGCHYNTPGNMHHPFDVQVPETMRPKVKDLFPLTDGSITCISCHSFEILCAKEKPGDSSLRGAPYQDRITFCFRCHDERQYERLNPHHQLDATGRIVEEKCLYCHTRKPDEARANFKSIRLVGDLEKLCEGCHNIGDKHPAGKPHHVRPDLEYQLRMRMLEKQYGIILPLDENGKLTCITCHNPHEAGVIPQTVAASKGAGEVFRHRLPKILCAECHWHSISTPRPQQAPEIP